MQLFKGAVSAVAHFPWTAALDVLLASVIIYYVIMLIKGTRAVQLAWGLVVIFLAARLAEWLQFRTLGLLLGTIATPGATVAIVILFYPELRHVIEEVGRGRLWAMRGLMLRREDVGVVVDDLVETATRLSHRRMGALMVLARDDGLDDIVNTGTKIGAAITPQLLVTIFYPGTPLHDGAVIIRGNEIIAAECVLPLSDNARISSSLHTRHRAALGLAERTDAAVLVVSEETGNISLAYDGRLLTALRPEIVRDKLLGLLQRDEGQFGISGDEEPPRDSSAGRRPKPMLDKEAKVLSPGRRFSGAVVGGLRDLGQRIGALRGRIRGENTD